MVRPNGRRLAVLLTVLALVVLLLQFRPDDSVKRLRRPDDSNKKPPPPLTRPVSSQGMREVMGEYRVPSHSLHGLNLIIQLPLKLTSSTSSGTAGDQLGQREREYVQAAEKTLQHAAVSSVHFLTEAVWQQLWLYKILNATLHSKVYTYNLNQRLMYAAAVRYANTYLQGSLAAISTADVSPVGSEWHKLTAAHLGKRRLLALTRHEKPNCGRKCDCSAESFDGCHDTFIFVPPLAGGEALLEQISFSVGGLWGSENRFLYEVKQANPRMVLENPCLTLHMEHHHCVGKGEFRPAQDERRVNWGNGWSKTAQAEIGRASWI